MSVPLKLDSFSAPRRVHGARTYVSFFSPQLGRRREERPRQVQRRSPSQVFGGGEEGVEEEARPEERTTGGLHGQLPRQLGNLPDQDAGQSGLSLMLLTETLSTFRPDSTFIALTELPGQKLLQPALPGAVCRLRHQLHPPLLQSKPAAC